MELVLTQLEDYQVNVTCDNHASHTFDLQPLRLLGHWFERISHDPISYGQLLFRALFPGGSTARQALNVRPERIVLVATDDDLDTLPWEYLYGPAGFLVLEIPFVRGLPSEQRISPPVLETSLHILAVPSNPLSPLVKPLNIDAEWWHLKEIIDPLPFNITLERVSPPTLQQVRSLLANKHQRVLHFMGHGGQVKDGAYLCFEKENGDLDLVEAEQLISRIRDTTFLITLNACVSASPGPTAFSNLAASIAKTKIPYALGMRFHIYDDDALAFSRTFYTQLAQGAPVEEALLHARRSLAQRPRMWIVGVPVLYTSLATPTGGFVQHAGASSIDEHQPRIEVSSIARAIETFQGRIDDLKRLGSLLTKGNRPRILTIHGGGGQGKTALAREAIERFAYAWPGGVWGIMLDPLPDRPGFVSQLAHFLGINVREIPNLQDMEHLVSRQLAARRTLLVLDNAETLIDAVEAHDPQATSLAEFIQQLPSTSVSLLVTSRIQLGWPSEITHELGGLTAEEGALLFRQYAPERLETIGKEEARQLSKKIEGHPLGLRLLAGAYSASTLSLKDFIQDYEEQLVQAENAYVGDEHRHRKLYASIETSVRYLNGDLRNLLSNLWIFQAPFLPEIARYIFDPDTEETHSLVSTQLATLWQRGLLARITITARDGTQVLYYLLPTTRPYIQFYLHSTMSQEELFQRYGEAYETFITMACIRLDQSALMVAIVKHIEKDLEQGERYIAVHRQRYYKAHWALVLYRLGKLHKAQAILEDVLEQAQGSDQQTELVILNNLGSVYQDTGQLQQALSLFKQALSLSRKVGNREIAVAILNNLGKVYQTMGQPQSALSFFEQALSIRRETNNRAGEAATLSNIAGIYKDTFHPQRALTLFEQTLLIMREIGDRTSEAIILNNMGQMYQTMGQPQRALSLFEQALPIRREIGDRNGEATTLHNMAGVYQDIGQPQQALSLFEQALTLRREIGNRPGAATALNNMAGVYQYIGQPQQSLSLLEQALLIIREIGDHASEATMLSNMGQMYQTIGQLQHALSLYEQALPITRKVGNRFSETKILNNMATVYQTMGQPQRALSLFEQALPIRREIGDRNGEANTLHNMAGVYQAIGQPQQALSLFEQALLIESNTGDRASEATTLNSMALAYQAIGQPQRALSLLEQALLITQEVGNRAGEAIALNGMASVYQDIGHSQRALSLFEQALPILREVGDHTREATSLTRMAILLYSNFERPHEALHYLEQVRQIFEHDSLPQGIDGDTLEIIDKIQEAIQQSLPQSQSTSQQATSFLAIQQQWIVTIIAIMTIMPEHQQEYRIEIEQMRHEAQKNGPSWQNEVDFYTSLLDILDGEKPSLPSDHPYSLTISAIQAGIAQRKLPKQDEEDETFIRVSDDDIAFLVNNTLAVLGEAANQRNEWREQLVQEKLDEDDNDFIMLLDTILALLDANGDPTGLGTALAGEYAQAWYVLVASLAIERVQEPFRG
ncbi:tetratricopeptide repeat protein [Ktedonobacter robiniae]|uniref:CHAT domain-containing protein n=1 Tax=Ktedonobacter robiniae TaxID=2778365 RepID=A0ABQ3UTR2_9CHLR|nr:tetratricopeptide repeat protein [Ktedonobacter robiniae]GHO56158.1 hypothetical protein KSB_46330 [Ktedonobacter robiniae]